MNENVGLSAGRVYRQLFGKTFAKKGDKMSALCLFLLPQSVSSELG